MTGTDHGAIFSSDRKYRYYLWRTWNHTGKIVSFVCLNPSIADEVVNDPTVTRCAGYARDWGFGGYTVENIFAYVSTDPTALEKVADPIGARNNDFLRKAHKRADLTIVAWGLWGRTLNRGPEVVRMLQAIKPVKCLGVNKGGSPKHPLYLRAALKPMEYP